MAEDELNNHQKFAFMALLELDRIFRENDIVYFLLYGSALGAIRHQGFIPWDDDIDIGIFLKDKNNVHYLLSTQLSSPFAWADNKVKPGFPRLFGKILYNGIGCVDIFPILKTSEFAIERRMQWINRKILFKLYKSKLRYKNTYEQKNLGEKIKVTGAVILSRLCPLDRILYAIEKNENRFEHLCTPHYYLTIYGAYNLEKETLKADWFTNQSYVIFEGYEFPTVSDPKSYLSHLYGNYMIPITDRSERHREERF